MKFCSSSVAHAAFETDMCTLALSKHPFLKYHQGTEITLRGQQATAAINTAFAPLLLAALPPKLQKRQGRARRVLVGAVMLPQQARTAQAKNLSHHCQVFSHVRQSHAALPAMPQKRRA